uniref:Uncharacterized protein n=1 Tax=Knipowitschia caucasica TaxID=637954 RepID=A0AAV2L7S1_KNICA
MWFRADVFRTSSCSFPRIPSPVGDREHSASNIVRNIETSFERQQRGLTGRLGVSDSPPLSHERQRGHRQQIRLLHVTESQGCWGSTDTACAQHSKCGWQRRWRGLGGGGMENQSGR